MIFSIVQNYFITDELEKKTTEQQKEIKTFEEKVSLLSFQLQENKSIQIGQIPVHYMEYLYFIRLRRRKQDFSSRKRGFSWRKRGFSQGKQGFNRQTTVWIRFVKYSDWEHNGLAICTWTSVNSVKIVFIADELEKIKTEEQREIAILKKENLLLSNQLEDNETDTQRNINSGIPALHN